MPKALRSLFQEELNQRKLKKKRQRIILIALFFLAIGSIFCLYNQLFPLLIIFILIKALLILRLVPMMAPRQFKDANLPPNPLKSGRLSKLNKRSLLTIAILVSVLIVQAYPSLITIPVTGMFTRLFHNPQPHDIASPWPWNSDQTLHSAIVDIPPDAEKSIETVAAYILETEPDPWLRTKAAHDYVIRHLTYDIDVIKSAGIIGSRPPQDAQTVFTTQKAVCEGYARLFKALGTSMGMDVAYVKGHIRRDLAPSDVIPPALRFANSRYDWTYHAWNMVKIEGKWFIVDATWDDSRDESRYRTDYLLLPPEVMIFSHRPEHSSWQLLENATKTSEFEKQPILSPTFFGNAFELRTPKTYESEVKQGMGQIQIKVPENNPTHLTAGFIPLKDQGFSFLDLVSASNQEDQEMRWCQTGKLTRGEVNLACSFPEPGDYQVIMFNENGTSRQSLGQLKFNYKS